MNRRQFVAFGVAAIAQLSFGEIYAAQDLEHELQNIEKNSGGRLGVSVLDTATGARVSRHGSDRFPMCSTFKLLAVGAVLARVDQGGESLDRNFHIEARDLVAYSPVTQPHAGGSMTLGELCEAAMTVSDNTAANLIVSALGGPAGVTAFARSLGDQQTRLDRTEPALNESVPGDERDTTTPDSMLSDLRALVCGEALAPASRERFTQWLLHNQTGDERLRAGVPRTWRVGDKTGSGQRGSTNDVAVLWPPERKPILIAVYLTDTTAPAAHRNATLAAVGRAVAATLS